MIPKGYRTIFVQVVATIGMLVTVWTGHDTAAEVDLIKDNIVAIDTAAVLI